MRAASGAIVPHGVSESVIADLPPPFKMIKRSAMGPQQEEHEARLTGLRLVDWAAQRGFSQDEYMRGIQQLARNPAKEGYEEIKLARILKEIRKKDQARVERQERAGRQARGEPVEESKEDIPGMYGPLALPAPPPPGVEPGAEGGQIVASGARPLGMRTDPEALARAREWGQVPSRSHPRSDIPLPPALEQWIRANPEPGSGSLSGTANIPPFSFLSPNRVPMSRSLVDPARMPPSLSSVDPGLILAAVARGEVKEEEGVSSKRAEKAAMAKEGVRPRPSAVKKIPYGTKEEKEVMRKLRPKGPPGRLLLGPPAHEPSAHELELARLWRAYQPPDIMLPD